MLSGILKTFLLLFVTTEVVNRPFYTIDNILDCHFFFHPENGKSIVKIYMDKVKGQTVDLKIFNNRGFFAEFTRQTSYYQKNFTSLKDISIAIENTNEEGYFLVCFTIIPDRGHITKPFNVKMSITSDKNEVDKIINSIFDMQA